ncbi:MAG: hypothetical protein RIQ63_1392, partial [Actinomycetota bacterium]
FASSRTGSDFATEFEIPASESNDVQMLLEANNPDRAGFSGEIVFTSPAGVDSDAVRDAMTELFTKVGQVEGVTVTSPYDVEGQINTSRTTAFASIDATIRSQTALITLGEEIRDLGKPYETSDLRIEYGGNIFAGFELPASEAYGLLAAIIILVLAFGSVLAMGLPIGTALVGLGVGASLVTVLSHVLPMPDFTTSLVAMIGLGVGIDYALFIVTRYREGIHHGMSVEDSVVNAVDTSGRAVIFAGITVIISLLGLFVMGLAFARGLAIGAVIGVLVMMIASISLLPALLAMVKHRIDVTSRAALIALSAFVVITFFAVVAESLPLFLAAVASALVVTLASFVIKPLRKPIPQRARKPKTETFWYRWSRLVQRRPWTSALGATAVLLLLGAPLLSIRLGFGDNGNAPESTTVRRAYDMLADGLRPIQPHSSPSSVWCAASTESLSPKRHQRRRTVRSRSSSPIRRLLHRTRPRRRSSRPCATTSFRKLAFKPRSVASPQPASTSPTSSAAACRFILLMAVFRSLLVPLKAVIMNLLSIGAAYGVIVAIFQWGWGMNLIGVDKAGPIESWAPMMLFAIVFGLSMDYEVFLLSRVREEYLRTGNNAEAVADGLTATARVITAAALIMVCVFAAFVLGYDRQLKLFGLGLALAVFIDATIVRMVLVPATMELLGDRNWWIPKWIDRMLPKIDVEGHNLDPVSDLA